MHVKSKNQKLKHKNTPTLRFRVNEGDLSTKQTNSSNILHTVSSVLFIFTTFSAIIYYMLNIEPLRNDVCVRIRTHVEGYPQLCSCVTESHVLTFCYGYFLTICALNILFLFIISTANEMLCTMILLLLLLLLPLLRTKAAGL